VESAAVTVDGEIKITSKSKSKSRRGRMDGRKWFTAYIDC